MLIYLNKLIQGHSLSRQEAQQVCHALCENSNMAQSAAILALLSANGETADEIAGFADVMKTMMVDVAYDKAAIDIVGTGGDGANTVNISTAAALVVQVVA